MSKTAKKMRDHIERARWESLRSGKIFTPEVCEFIIDRYLAERDKERDKRIAEKLVKQFNIMHKTGEIAVLEHDTSGNFVKSDSVLRRVTITELTAAIVEIGTSDAQSNKPQT